MMETKTNTNSKPLRIKFFQPDSLVKRFKATVHKTGKLGFTNTAAKQLLLSKGRRLLIGVNQDNPKDKSLYMTHCKNDSKDGFLVARAGEYYYINLSGLFDSIGLDYRSGKIIYDISKHDYNGEPMYKFSLREGE